MIYHFRDRERERERERERGKMEVSMSLNALVRLPLSNSRAREDFFFKTTFPSPRRSSIRTHRKVLVVEAKGKKGMAARQFQRAPPPPLPKLEDDGNPKFVIFIRTANDEKQIQRSAFKQFRVLRSATAFRYGYKLVENNNLRSALSTSDVIELPTQEELKTVLDKVVNFFGDAASGAKESFGKLTSLTSTTDEESEEKSEVKS
ncbi:multidrug resistance protein isoform X2 [Tasmannia lanceolata]|uniref:multidrug resistance protein isoform X2 n=1 Tax=Tasmannia lanceolata TaxID=3420 RepID=UPI00406371A6